MGVLGLVLVRPLGVHATLRCWEASGRFTALAGAHPSTELAWVESGEVEYCVGSRRTVVHPGQWFFVPAGVVHQTSFLGPGRAGSLALSLSVVSELAEVVGGRGATVEAGGGHGGDRLLALTRVLEEEVRRAEPGHLLAAESILEAIAIIALRGADLGHTQHPAVRDPRVRRAVEHMRSSYAEALSVDDMAKAAGMSRFHFSRLFREQVGCAPYQYLLGVRLDGASELLRGGRHTVTEAALAAGFHDLGRFGRMFRERFGVRPTELATSARNA